MDKLIAIVEDDNSMLQPLKTKLSDYAVIWENDGEKGLQMILDHHPDISILDVLLPSLSGIRILEEIRKDKWGKNAKVIILTSIDPESDMLQKINELKPMYYLIKTDIKLDELKQKIDAEFPKKV